MNVAVGSITVKAQNIRWVDIEPNFTFNVEIGVDNFQCKLRISGNVGDFETNDEGNKLIRKLAKPKAKQAGLIVAHNANGVFNIKKEDAIELVKQANEKELKKLVNRKTELERKLESAKAELEQFDTEMPILVSRFNESARKTIDELAHVETVVAYS